MFLQSALVIKLTKANRLLVRYKSSSGDFTVRQLIVRTDGTIIIYRRRRPWNPFSRPKFISRTYLYHIEDLFRYGFSEEHVSIAKAACDGQFALRRALQDHLGRRPTQRELRKWIFPVLIIS